MSRPDAEREADQAAKAEFEARLKERDEAKTRKLMEKKYTKEELDDIERRKYKDEDEKAALVPKLRWVWGGVCAKREGHNHAQGGEPAGVSEKA